MFYQIAMMRINPITSKLEAVPDACIVKIFAVYDKIGQPFVDKLLKAADNAVLKFPSFTTNHTIAVNNALTNLRSLLSKINSCVLVVKLSDRILCASKIVSINSISQYRKIIFNIFDTVCI
jgi:hypothetical protein